MSKLCSEMTDQEVFDTVVVHLLTQNKKSQTGNTCRYRSDRYEGRVLKCAVGCLIPDELYDKSIEGESVLNEGVLFCLGYSDSIGVVASSRRLNILIDLQVVHDDNNPSSWREGLAIVAKAYKLKFNPPHVEVTPDGTK